jgi:hypothetical protein
MNLINSFCKITLRRTNAALLKLENRDAAYLSWQLSNTDVIKRIYCTIDILTVTRADFLWFNRGNAILEVAKFLIPGNMDFLHLENRTTYWSNNPWRLKPPERKQVLPTCNISRMNSFAWALETVESVVKALIN